MDEALLRELIGGPHELDTLELTTTLKDKDKLSEAICAFANDYPNKRQPGYLIIGVDDRRRIAPQRAIGDQELQDLVALRDNGNIQPLPTMTVEKIATAEGDVAVITVQPSLLPPVRYRGRVCIRMGPRKSYASEAEERILIEKRVSHARSFDAEPCLGGGLSDLDVRLFQIEYLPRALAPEIIEENHRELRAQLASLRFYDLKSDCPTNAGMLLFGLDVRRWIPGAYIQFLRVDGNGLDAPVLEDRELSGDLLSVLRSLDSLVELHVQRALIPATSLTESVTTDVPLVAIRELLLNAIVHRDYRATSPVRLTWLSDRIEIQNPGGLYGEASPENFPNQTSYRNPVVAESAKLLGYVNRFGRGVVRAQAALQKNGNEPARFEHGHSYTLAIIPRKR